VIITVCSVPVGGAVYYAVNELVWSSFPALRSEGIIDHLTLVFPAEATVAAKVAGCPAFRETCPGLTVTETGPVPTREETDSAGFNLSTRLRIDNKIGSAANPAANPRKTDFVGVSGP